MRNVFILGLILTAMNMSPTAVHAGTEADVDRMTTYAVILGRAIGCGIGVDAEMRRVGSWMDRVFPPGSVDQQTFLPIFVAGLQYHAEAQANGNSPDSCNMVRREYSQMLWP